MRKYFAYIKGFYHRAWVTDTYYKFLPFFFFVPSQLVSSSLEPPPPPPTLTPPFPPAASNNVATISFGTVISSQNCSVRVSAKSQLD